MLKSFSKYSIPGSRTLSNLSRKADMYGNVHFISFYCSVLSRLAYFNDKKFLDKYSSIFGSIIPESILTCINAVPKISNILDDEIIFKLNSGNPYNFPIYEYNGKKFIPFIEMCQQINIVNGEINNKSIKSSPDEKVKQRVKYISIATSNYGEIYVVADQRMHNSIFIVFRGTYSGKTAAAYTKPTSLIPLYVGNSGNKRESYMYGIFKITVEVIHTIIEAVNYLATHFLNAATPNSIKVFTCGHSLGGAMCTNFAYLWMRIKKTSPYNNAPYNILSDDICCVSLGAPRSFNTDISELFCNYVKEEKITFLRITTRGDPVPSMPLKVNYFSHPCSDSISVKAGLREKVSEDCNSQLITRPFPNVNYKGALDCQNYKTRIYAPNPLSHTIYLDIMYTNAVNIMKFAYSTVSFTPLHI